MAENVRVLREASKRVLKQARYERQPIVCEDFCADYFLLSDAFISSVFWLLAFVFCECKVNAIDAFPHLKKISSHAPFF
jgi:hypothetical protein